MVCYFACWFIVGLSVFDYLVDALWGFAICLLFECRVVFLLIVLALWVDC